MRGRVQEQNEERAGKKAEEMKNEKSYKRQLWGKARRTVGKKQKTDSWQG